MGGVGDADRGEILEDQASRRPDVEKPIIEYRHSAFRQGVTVLDR